MSISFDKSLSVANPHPYKTDGVQKTGLSIAAIGVLILFISLGKAPLDAPLFLTISLVAIFGGTALYAYRTYMSVPEGIKNHGVWLSSFTNRGVWGWIVGVILTGFYVLLYWYDGLLGNGTGTDGANEGLVALFDPISMLLKNKPATQWFVYGTLYTVSILGLGVKFMLKYRHNRYQFVRTVVVMISQLFLAYLIPEILESLNYGGVNYYSKDLKNMWPLNVYFTDSWYLNNLQNPAEQPLGMFYLVWGIILFTVVTPVVTYFVGKRWYCSWVCGCGGLAETAGDPYRQLSDKSLEAWKLERYLIHGVIAFVFIMTGMLMTTYFTGYNFKLSMSPYLLLALIGGIFGFVYYKEKKKHPYIKHQKAAIVLILSFAAIAFYLIYNSGGGSITFTSGLFRQWYGFFIGSAFSGVIGVGFYPLLGNRVWCRFGCPLAGYMGLIQRFKSKFRITTNGGQCISCGNCSTYCEQGIDVRSYAQKGQNIVRASCVGCGICAAVCPRGVLKLENGPEENRTDILPEIVGTTMKK